MGLPLFDEPKHPRLQQYAHQHTKDWSASVSRADAFVFVTPEYNHSFPASLKNALDYLSMEWADKPVGLASYGGVSAGLRAATALKPILAALRMVPVVEAVSVPFFTEHIGAGGEFTPNPQLEAGGGGIQPRPFRPRAGSRVRRARAAGPFPLGPPRRHPDDAVRRHEAPRDDRQGARA